MISKICNAPEVIQISHNVLKVISREGSPEGLLAEIRTPRILTETDQIPLKERVLLLFRISDPGNLGTLIRTAIAFNWNRIVLLDDCVDPFNPECIRSSMGAGLRASLYRIRAEQLEEFSHKNGIKCLIADSNSDRSSLNNYPLRDRNKSLGLSLGSEANGFVDFPTNFYKSCDKISLKMENNTESLNIAVCGGILMNKLRD